MIGLDTGSLSGTKDEMVAILNIDTILSYKITHKEMIIPAARMKNLLRGLLLLCVYECLFQCKTVLKCFAHPFRYTVIAVGIGIKGDGVH